MSTNVSDVVKPTNPANKTVEAQGARKRVPMSTPTRKLEVPEIPGFHTHWMRESNIPRAIAAMYEFVDWDEVPVNQRNVGTDTQLTGNTDLGSRISVVGGTGQNGMPERLVLMKLREEYWKQDREVIDSRNASIIGSIFRGERILDKGPVGQDVEDTRYVDPDRTFEKRALFNRPRRKV